MSFFKAPQLKVGTVSVTTTENGGHDVEFWSESASNKIVSVGGDCHPVIADQAVAFKDAVNKVIAYYMKEAIKSDRTTLTAEFERQGHKDMADIIRSL